MRVLPNSPSYDEVFSLEEVARAAHVPLVQLQGWLHTSAVPAATRFLNRADAIRAVRQLRERPVDEADAVRAPLTLLPAKRRKTGAALVISLVIHGAFLALLLTLASLGFFNAVDTEQLVTNPVPIRLVFLTTPGPGGGGGGGGLVMPQPPPPAERKAPPRIEKKIASPVPPPKRTPAPPPPVPPPLQHIDPTPVPVVVPPIETPRPTPTPQPVPPPQAVQAPVVPIATGTQDRAGTPGPAPPGPASNGPGTGGGVGSGAGVGIGEGQGGGIGPGSGGGTGGGPFQPGSGVSPPVLLREVRPGYTDEARKRAIEGDVVLEIVVRQDGSVGNVRVTRSLGAGLEQKAIDAVRQWKFGPAKRQGAPVDVVVEVSVEFKLR